MSILEFLESTNRKKTFFRKIFSKKNIPESNFGFIVKISHVNHLFRAFTFFGFFGDTFKTCKSSLKQRPNKININWQKNELYLAF
jgi:hypothetical protein